MLRLQKNKKIINITIWILFFALLSPTHNVFAATKTITPVGNAQIDTAQSKFGGASGLLDGTGDYIYTADNNDWNFGTGNFTIDFWVRFNALNTYNYLFSQRVNSSNFFDFNLFQNGSNFGFQFSGYDNNNMLWNFYDNGSAIVVNTWYHVAVVRNGTDWRIYLNGTSMSYQTGSFTAPDLAAPFVIGARGDDFANQLNGWIDEFRITKGVARWTTNFTPPTSEYTTDSNTVLLLHMNGTDASTTFIDDSIPPSTLTQSSYKWFANDNSTGVGRGTIMNQPATSPSQGTPFRLRLLLHGGAADIAQNATTSLLQFAQKSGTCDTSFTGESYTNVSSTTGAIRYYNNASATDGAALTANYEDPRHASSTLGIGHDTVRNQIYSEGNNNFSNSQSAIAVGEDGLWDFSLVDYSALQNTSYCFRAVQAGGGTLSSYEVIPEIKTAQTWKIKLHGNIKLRTIKFK